MATYTSEEIQKRLEVKKRFKELAKCRKDPVYFAKNYCYIKHPIKGLIKFEPYDYQCVLLHKFQKKQFNIILKSRQTGISTLVAIFITWLISFSGYAETEIISNRQKSAIGLVDKISVCVNEIRRHWPWLIPKRTSNNIKSVNLANNSKVTGEATSDDAGRSESLTLLILDEAAHIRNVDDVWMAAKPTLSTGGKCVMLSTPNGVGNLFHQTWVNSTKGQTNFETTQIHWTQCPAYTSDLTFDKDGKPTSSWYVDQCKDLNQDHRKIAQELDLDFLGSGDMVIRADDLKKHTERLRNGIESKELEELFRYKKIEPFCRGKTLLFEKPVRYHDYVLCADVARGDGKDWSAFHVLDMTEMPGHKLQVFEYCAKVPPDDYAKVIKAIAEWYNEAYVIVECNSIGLVTTIKLEEMKYKKLYYTEKNKKIPGRGVKFEREDVVKERLPGFETTSGNRHLIIAQIEEEVRNETLIFQSHRLYSEFTTFVYKDNGKAEAESNYNDDLIMSIAIGLFVISTSFKKAIQNRARNEEMLKQYGMSSGERTIDHMNVQEKIKEGEFTIPKTNPFIKEDIDMEDMRWVLG
jgi:hypothetical protein